MVGLVTDSAITLTAKILYDLRSSDILIRTSQNDRSHLGEGDRTKKSSKGNGEKYQSPTSRILQYKSSILPERIIWSNVRLSGTRSQVKSREPSLDIRNHRKSVHDEMRV
jgi:hypothetical protein